MQNLALLLLLACLFAAAQGNPTPAPTASQDTSEDEPYTADDMALILEVQTDESNFEYAESNGWNCTDADDEIIENTLRNLIITNGWRRDLHTERNMCKACSGWSNQKWSYCVATFCRRRRLSDDHEAYQGHQQWDRKLTVDQIPPYLQDACDDEKAILFDAFKEQSLPGISQGCRDAMVFTETLEHLYQADLVIYCFISGYNP